MTKTLRLTDKYKNFRKALSNDNVIMTYSDGDFIKFGGYNNDKTKKYLRKGDFVDGTYWWNLDNTIDENNITYNYFACPIRDLTGETIYVCDKEEQIDVPDNHANILIESGFMEEVI